MDKRKGIILAVVLFLIIGLGTFVFAGNSESGLKSNTTNPSGNDGNDGQTPSGSGEEVSNPEGNGEIEGEGGKENPGRDTVTDLTDDYTNNQAPDSGNNDDNTGDVQTINFAELLAKLSQMVADASKRSDILDAIDYREENKITAENIATLNDEQANKLLETVNTILNDKTPPTVDPEDLDGKYFNDTVSIKIDDSETAYTYKLEKLDGEMSEGTTLSNIDADGIYRLTVTDAAFNEVVATFTVDKSDATFNVNNSEHFTEAQEIIITDSNLEKVEVKNQDDPDKNAIYTEVVDGKITFTITEDATYHIYAYDKAGNVIDIWVAKDSEKADIKFLDEDENELSKITNKDVTIEVFDKFLTEVTVKYPNGDVKTFTYANKNDEYFTTTNGTEYRTFSLEVSEEGTYTVIAKDKAGNTTEEQSIEIDETKIAKEWLYTLNSTYHTTDMIDKHYQVIGDGQKLYVELVFTEEFVSTPQISIGDSEDATDMVCGWTNWENVSRQYYKCDATITIDGESQRLENGQEIPVNITNIKDAAGNVTTLTTDDIDSTTYEDKTTPKYGKVVYDNAVDVDWVYILNSTNKEDRQTIGEGQKLLVEINASEELIENPVFKVGEYEVELQLREDDPKQRYIYDTYITLTEEVISKMGLVDGENIDFTIDVKDPSGNTVTLTKGTVHEEAGYGESVKFDASAPEVTLLGIYNLTTYGTETQQYAKNGDTIRVLVYFAEELGTEPIVKITGTNVTETATYREQSSNPSEGTYAYYADIKITEDMNLADGPIKFTVYGYGDKFNNTVAEDEGIDQSKTNMSENLSVVLDNTLASAKFQGGHHYSKWYNIDYITVTITEKNISEVYYVWNNKADKYIDATNPVDYIDNGDGTYTVNVPTIDGRYKLDIKVVDKAGNVAEIHGESENYNIDKTAPIVDFPNTQGKNESYISRDTLDITITERELKEVYYTWRNIDSYQTATILVPEENIVKNEDGTYTVKVPTVDGRNRLNIKAIDTAGNVTEVYSKSGAYNIDTTEASVDVEYSTTALTNDNVEVTIKANEKITMDDTSWTKVTDTEYTKEYSENITEKVIVKDRAGNETEVEINISNIDKTNPQVEFKEATVGSNGKYVNMPTATVVITEENLKEVYYGWYFGNKGYQNATTLVPEKNITKNNDGTYTVEVPTIDGRINLSIKAVDEAGNETKISHKKGFYNVDNTPADVDVDYDPENATKGTVVVTIKANEKITMDDTSWTKVTDTEYTKEYSENATEEVIVKDRADNVTVVKIDFSNIDKSIPVVKFNGARDVKVELGTTYSELGATVTDNGVVVEDKLQPTKITLYTLANKFVKDVTETGVDPNVEGRYLLYYDYIDAAGNSSKVNGETPYDAKRWVIVEDTKGPDIEGVVSGGEYFVSIPYKMTDPSGIDKIYYNFNGNYQTCEELMEKANDYEIVNVMGKTEYSSDENGAFQYDSDATGISVCVVDMKGNKTFLNNISYHVNANNVDATSIAELSSEPATQTIDLDSLTSNGTIVGSVINSLVQSEDIVE